MDSLNVQNNVTAVHVSTKILLAATKGLVASILCGMEEAWTRQKGDLPVCN